MGFLKLFMLHCGIPGGAHIALLVSGYSLQCLLHITNLKRMHARVTVVGSVSVWAKQASTMYVCLH